MEITVSRLTARRLESGDEAHRVEFNDGTRAYFHFSGGEVRIVNPDGTREAQTWDLEDDLSQHEWALQEEYARIDQAQGDYLEMTDAEYDDWKQERFN